MRSALLLAAVWAALCNGCGADVPPTGREGEPVTVTVLNPDYEIIFNPLWDMPAKFLLFLPMVRFDDSGEVVPSLARSWENSEDYREWCGASSPSVTSSRFTRPTTVLTLQSVSS